MPVCLELNNLKRGDSEQEMNNPTYKSNRYFLIKHNNKVDYILTAL